MESKQAFTPVNRPAYLTPYQPERADVAAMHHLAMDYAELAFVAKRKGEPAAAQHTMHALGLEVTAAMMLKAIPGGMDSISFPVLCKSAACLALDARMYHTALWLVQEGLQRAAGELYGELAEVHSQIVAEMLIQDKQGTWNQSFFSVNSNDQKDQGESHGA